MGISEGARARENDAPEAQLNSVDAEVLPENVIPLRPHSLLPSSAPGVVPNEMAPELTAADTASTRGAPTPIFGRAAINLPEWPTILVFGGLVASLLVVLFDSFRRGTLIFGAAMAVAFFLRLVLTDREAGMLKVRTRNIDLLILGAFAGSITLLAFWVPAPS